MNRAATIAATGFFTLCAGAAYYLIQRPSIERLQLEADGDWCSTNIECPVCTHENEIIGPPMLTEVPCANCGHTLQLDGEE